MRQTPYAKGEVAERATEIYEQEIRAKVEPGNKGKYLVIDIETGAYDIGEDQFVVMKRAKAKYPDGTLFAMRIGYRALGSIGFVPAGT